MADRDVGVVGVRFTRCLQAHAGWEPSQERFVPRQRTHAPEGS